MKWNVNNLDRSAVAISASRRTDIPGLYAVWFMNRLEAGFAEYIARVGRVQKSIRPEDVTHFNFWTKWPRPFRRALERVVGIGYPTLWNVTLTGLARTVVEPYVPRAIQWRYDPVFLSERFPPEFHVRTFRKLAELLGGYVDRVAVSFVASYNRRVAPDLRRYERETGDRVIDAPLAQQVDLVGELGAIAAACNLPLTVCCSPELRQQTGLPVSGCNNFAWASRVYPALQAFRRQRAKPTRPDCGCSEEWDIGCYDTCVFACPYSYGSCNCAKARENFRRHDPTHPCLIPRGEGNEPPVVPLSVNGE